MRHADVEMAIHLNGAENKQAFVKEIPGGSTLLYKPYSCAAPSGRVLASFGRKTGLIHFAHFGLELHSGMVFEGTTECMKVFIVSIPNEQGKKEKNTRIQNGLE